jgi:hypothetical protein
LCIVRHSRVKEENCHVIISSILKDLPYSSSLIHSAAGSCFPSPLGKLWVVTRF